MKAVDTNILVYAEIVSSPFHTRAHSLLQSFAEGIQPWCIPWPCLYEFMRIITHRKVYHPPVPLEIARADLQEIVGSPSLLLLSETERHSQVLDRVLADSAATGSRVHDAHIAALCIEHGVQTIVTGDRDFLRFAGLDVENPFTA